jgi:hypothetical protein
MSRGRPARWRSGASRGVRKHVEVGGAMDEVDMLDPTVGSLLLAVRAETTTCMSRRESRDATAAAELVSQFASCETAARTRNHGTARATPTRTARRATAARSSGAGPPSACSRRCSSGNRATEGCPRPTTGRARTPVGVGERRSGGSPKEIGPRRAWLPGCSALGPSLAPRLRGQTRRCQHAGRRRSRDWAVTRSHCLIPGNPQQNPRI